MTTVAVLGATGELGARVCRLLQRWVPGVMVVGANRTGSGHTDFPVRRADVRDAGSLAALLRDADLVVNAVGPYGYDPDPLVSACVSSRCHYADLAEDLPFLARLERAARARGAAAAGVTLVPGCSTVPGLVQLLAGRWRGRDDVAAVDAWLSMGSRNPVSRGLLTGLLRPLGRKGASGARAFTRLSYRRMGDGRRLGFGLYPAPFPRSGLRLGARRVPVTFRVGFDRAWLNRALALGARGLGRLPERAVDRLAPALLPLARLARPLGTPYGVLAVVARDAAGRELGSVEIRARAAGLDVPAAPPVWLARALRAGGRLPAVGVVGLDRVVPLEAALAWFREAGYEVAAGEAGEGASAARR